MRGFLLQLKNILLEYMLSIKGVIKMKEKTASIVSAIITIALGILIAIFGFGALDIYVGIGCLVAGVVLAVVNIVFIAKKKPISFSGLFLGVALIVIGIFLLTGYLSFGVLEHLIVAIILGLGIALALYGILTIAVAKQVPFGVVQMILGLAIIALAIVYMNVAEFRQAFWIIVGVIIAIYGVLDLVMILTSKKKK